MKRKTMLLGLGSMIMVAAPLTATISCGGFDDLEDQQDQGVTLDNNKPDENKTTTFDVGLSEYKPYNFVVKESFYNVISEQASEDHYISPYLDDGVTIDPNYRGDDDFDNDGISYEKANQWLKMIAPTQDGRYVAGVDVWLAKAIAEDMNKEVVFHERSSFDDLIPGLNNGSYDAIISGFSATPQREARGVEFSNPYWQPKNGILYVKDSELGQIAEKSITFDPAVLTRYHGAAMIGTTQQSILNEFLGANAQTLSEGSLNMETGVSTLVSVETGVDYMICENTLADYFKTEYRQDATSIELGYVNVDAFNADVDNISVGVRKNGEINLDNVNSVIEKEWSSVGTRFRVASDIALENHKDKYIGHTSATK